MRGVAGILFVFLGLVMGYLILSGKFPSSSPIVNTSPAAATATPVTGNTQQQTANRLKSLNSGSGGSSFGLPTVKHLSDVAASYGGMR